MFDHFSVWSWPLCGILVKLLILLCIVDAETKIIVRLFLPYFYFHDPTMLIVIHCYFYNGTFLYLNCNIKIRFTTTLFVELFRFLYFWNVRIFRDRRPSHNRSLLGSKPKYQVPSRLIFTSEGPASVLAWRNACSKPIHKM